MFKILNKSKSLNIYKYLLLLVNIIFILLTSFLISTTNKYISFVNEDSQIEITVSYLGKGDYSINEIKDLMEIIGVSYNEYAKEEETFYQTGTLDIKIPYLNSKAQVKVVSYSQEYVNYLKESKSIDESQARILQESNGAIIPDSLSPYVNERFFNYVVENSVSEETTADQNAIAIEGTYNAQNQTIMVSEQTLSSIAAKSGVTPNFDLKIIKTDLKSAVKFKSKFEKFISTSDYAISVSIDDPLYNDIIFILVKNIYNILITIVIFNMIMLLIYFKVRKKVNYKEDFKIISNMGISSKRIYTSSILNNSLYYFGATVLGLLISLLGFRFYCNNFVIKSINDFENMQNNTLFDSTSANSVNLNLEVNIPAIAIIILFGYIVVNIFTKKSCKNSLRS